MTAALPPQDGFAYTPEQVSDAGWLGDITADGLRKAASRGDIQHTRIRNRIHFTRANILAIQEAGFREAKKPTAPFGRPVTRRRQNPVTAKLPPGVEPLQPRPESAKRRNRRAS